MSGAASALPLRGLRVIEMSHMVMGPACGMILADLGAEVIKIEPPGKGDRTRYLVASGTGFFPAFSRSRAISACVSFARVRAQRWHWPSRHPTASTAASATALVDAAVSSAATPCSIIAAAATAAAAVSTQHRRCSGTCRCERA
jgi:hypothetical protein